MKTHLQGFKMFAIAMLAFICNARANNNDLRPVCTLTVTITSQTNIKCNGGNTGSATASASGGSGTYSYSWTTSPPQTGATVTSLTAGTYKVIVTDPISGCIDSASVNITQPNPIVIKDSITNVTCHGANNGTVTAHVSGGTKAYSYLWSNGGTDSAAVNLSQGTYTITITDANSCTASATVSITQPTALTSSASSTSAECGKNNGMAVVTATGGTPSYTYSWAPSGGTKDTAQNISAGTYTATVTDSNGCTSGSIVVVNGTSPPTETITNKSDSGGCTGTATASAAGGTAPYTYLWNGGQTSTTISGQCAGTYCCKVTDSKGCTDSVCTTIVLTAINQINAIIGGYTIYPNPSKDVVNINGSYEGNKLITIYNVMGQSVCSATSNKKQDVLNISGLSAGIYFMNIRELQTGNSYMLKLSKK